MTAFSRPGTRLAHPRHAVCLVLCKIATIYEVATHLRGEAGDRQIDGNRVGLTHVIGLSSACAVHILEKASA